jgi:hypothetical protein
MNANAARRANCPSVHQLLVFCREAAIGSPVHVPRLRRDLVDFGAASPTKTLPQFFDLIERALICWLPLRGMHQAVTLPTAEIMPTIKRAAAATTFQACQPLSLATEARCAVREWHEFVDLDPNAVAIGDAVLKA